MRESAGLEEIPLVLIHKKPEMYPIKINLASCQMIRNTKGKRRQLHLAELDRGKRQRTKTKQRFFMSPDVKF